MLCKSCSTEVPEGQPFCGQCGHKVNDDNLASVAARVARIEAQIAASSSNVAQQNYLELETAERVMARVKTWTTLILYFAGIPAALLLLALAVMFGKGTLDLYHIASSAKQSVNGILKEAQT